MSRLQWTFELLDRVSAPARRINQALRATETALKRADRVTPLFQGAIPRALGLSDRAAGQLGRTLGSLSQAPLGGLQARIGALHTGLSGAVGSVVNLKNALVAGAVGVVGKGFIDQIGFLEQKLISFKSVFGDIGGKNAFEWSLNFANITPFETPDVVGAVLRLSTVLKPTQIEPVMNRLSDALSATGNASGDALDRATLAIQQIASRPNAAFQDLNQLAQLIPQTWDILAEKLPSVTGGKTGDAGKAAILAALEKGQVPGLVALGALIDGFKRWQGASEAQSKTIFGLVSTLKSLPGNIAKEMLTFDPKTPGPAEPLRRLLQNLVEIFDFSKSPGNLLKTRLTNGLSGLFKTAFGPLAAATEPKRAAAAIEAFLTRSTQIIARVQAVWPQVRAGAMEFFQGVRAGLGVLSALGNTLGEALAWLERASGGFRGLSASVGGSGVSLLGLGGGLAVLFGALRVLNLLTLGGAGALLRLGGNLLWLGARALLVGARMHAAWLLALGPIGWLIGAVELAGLALGVAYLRIEGFRKRVNAAWDGIKQAGKGLLDWFTSLPERIGATFAQLPELLQRLLRQAVDLLPPGVREVVRGLAFGLKDGQKEVSGAASQLAQSADLGFRTPLEIRSPSRRFAYLGRMLGSGLEGGMHRSLGQVQRAAAGLALATTLSLPQPEAPASLSLPPTPSPSRTVNVTVGPITVNAGAEAKAVAEEVRAVAVEAVLEALERAEREVGA